MMMKNRILNLAMATSALLFSVSTHAFLVDFNDSGIVHGTVINSQFGGLTISANNPNHSGPDYAVAYDTTPRWYNNRDRDLTGPSWGNSNLGDVSNLNLGNLLIIQENTSSQSEGCSTGVCSFPDDEGSRPAGSLYFDFDTAITSFGFDLIDVEGPEFGTDSGYAAVFRDANGMELSRVGFGELIARDGAAFGDNSVNRVSEFGFSETDMVTRVEINFGGSAGIDNIIYNTTQTPPVPPQAVAEPTSLLLLAIGLTGLGLRRRKV